MNRLMKTTLFALLISTGYSYAQPVIQNIKPGTNYNANLYELNNVPGPGQAGANLTWDFGFYPYFYQGKVEYVPMGGSKFEGDFSGANLVYRLRAFGDTTWNYYRSVNDSIAIMGENMNAMVESNYTPNRKLLFRYPFNYLDSLVDPWQSYNAQGKVFRKYDGYGTIKIPFNAQYDNVVRVLTRDTITSPSFAIRTRYTWYTVNPLIPVAEYNESNGQMTFLYVFNTSVENTGSYSSISEVSPNPFSSRATLHINKPVKGMELSIMNTLGQVVRRMSLTGAATSIERHELAPGLYFYKVQSPEGTVTGGKFVIE